MSKKNNKRMVSIAHEIARVSLLYDENGYENSEWAAWLEWVGDMRKRELERIGNNNISGEIYEDEHGKVVRISYNMYAAMVVSVWARIERCLGAVCVCLGEKDPDGSKVRGKPNINDYDKYIYKKTGVHIQDIGHYGEANVFRVLSNAYKHNCGFYKPDQYNIKHYIGKGKMLDCIVDEQNPIKYDKLPMRQMIEGAAKFCKELIKRIE